jgi:uncharacterized protein YjiS (DUF1127 family)
MNELLSWWRAAGERRRVRRAQRELPALDEHTLRDIGVARSEFGSFWAESHGVAEATRRRVLEHLDRRLGL